MKETHPVASVDRLRELNMNIAIYPSCGAFIQRSVPNVGKVTDQKGCKWAETCEWAKNTKHMQMRDETDVKPRPRFVKTRFVKPNPTGPGDIVIDNYCGCFRWHESLAKRNRKNRELARVIGGEGDTVNIKTSKRVVQADNSVIYEDDYKTVTIPRFPDPTESKDLKQDVFAAKAKAEVAGADFQEDEQEEARRLGVAPASRPLGEGAEFVEMGMDDAKKVAGVG